MLLQRQNYAIGYDRQEYSILEWSDIWLRKNSSFVPKTKKIYMNIEQQYNNVSHDKINIKREREKETC